MRDRLRRPVNHALRRLRGLKRAWLPDFELADHRRLLGVYELLVGWAGQKLVDDVRGHRMRLDPHDSLRLSLNGVYEPAETRFLEETVQPGWVVADVGANIGYYTLLLARAVGEAGRVLAFEPDPANAALLAENVALNRYQERVALHQLALGAEPGRLTLYRNLRNHGDHRCFPPDPEELGARGVQTGRAAGGSGDGPSWDTVEVEVQPLDALLAPSERLDLIKMDVQGAEQLALKGMAQTLRSRPQPILLVEFWPYGLARAGVAAEELPALLSGWGFELHELPAEGGGLRPVDREALCRRLTAANRRHTNLVCRRG